VVSGQWSVIRSPESLAFHRAYRPHRSYSSLPCAHAHVRPCGFTLIELLVVILIIGILAAVAIPQFGDTSRDARLAALDQNLASMRAAIDLYYYQHNNTYPGNVAVHKVGATGLDIVHATALDAFTRQLAMYSDADGNTSDTKDTAFPFGPYLKKGVPENPLPADSCTAPASVIVSADLGPLSPDVKPTTGWKTSSQTGEFIANNTEYSSR